MSLHTCTKCKVEKSITDYYPSNKYYCKVCASAMTKASKQKRLVNSEGVRLSKKDRDKRDKKAKARKELIKATVKDSGFSPAGLTKYWPGSTMKEALGRYKGLSYLQNDLCAICKNPETVRAPNGEPKRLAVDHCHTTGKVRGLLCQFCNTKVMAVLDKSPDLINAGLNYLNKIS